MLGVRAVVVGEDFDETHSGVKPSGFDQVGARVQAQRGNAVLATYCLHLRHEPCCNATATGRRHDIDALDLTDAVRQLCAQHSPGAATIAVIAAGEQWPDGGLRPAVEDLWGAGAVIAGLADAGRTALPPEAELAEAGYQTVRGRERQALLSWASGRELVDPGYRADVEVAAEAGLSDAIPLLSGGRFVTAAGSLMVGRGRPSRVGGWC